MANIEVTAPGKLAVMLVALVGSFGVIIFQDPSNVPAWTTIGTLVGYLAGNGVGAKRGQETVAAFSPKTDP